MTNLDAIRALCTKICTGFYPDKNVLEFTLIDNGIEATEKNIASICKEYGMDSSEFVEEPSVSDGSNQW